MTLEEKLIERRDYLLRHEDDYESEKTVMYWRGRADGISEVLDMLENYTNE